MKMFFSMVVVFWSVCAFADDVPEPSLLLPSWSDSIALDDPDVSAFVKARVDGLFWYSTSLETFAKLSREDQLEILQTVEAERPSGGDVLIEDLRIPLSLVDEILLEAERNGANRIQLRGYKAALLELRIDGSIGSKTGEYIVQKAPNSASGMAQISALALSITENERATSENERATSELERATSELERSNARLKAQMQATEALRKAAEATSGISD